MNRMKKFMAMLLAVVLVAQSGFTSAAEETVSAIPSVIDVSADAPDAEQPAEDVSEPAGEVSEPAEESGQTSETETTGTDGTVEEGPAEEAGTEDGTKEEIGTEDGTKEETGTEGQETVGEETAGDVQEAGDQKEEAPAKDVQEGTAGETAGDQTETETPEAEAPADETAGAGEANGQEETPAGDDANVEESLELNPNLVNGIVANSLDQETRAETVISASMTQEEIDEILQNTAVVTVEAGDYSVIRDGKNYHKIVRLDAGQTINLSGAYTRLQIIVSSENATINADDATMNGQAEEVSNQSAAIYLQTGSVTLNGSLDIDNYDYGLRLGYTNAGTEENAKFTISSNSELSIVNCIAASDNSYYGNGIDDPDNKKYFSYVDRQGDGTRASAITTKGKGYTTVRVEEGASLICTDNAGAGIFSINVSNFTLGIGKNGQVHLDKNGQGLCMNTDYSSTCNVNLEDHAALTCDNNRSNGITGQNRPYIINAQNGSSVSSSNNGDIGINNFYVLLDNSTLTVNDNGSHGATNVSLDAYNDSSVICNGNAYIGLNITKFNDGQSSTNIENSTLTVENNGGSGVRFHVAVTSENAVEETITGLPENAEVRIVDSVIIALGNGIGTSLYGYAVKPGDSGYWADICASCTVDSEGSYITCDSAYSLYNRGASSLRASSILSVGKNDVIQFGIDGAEGKGKQTVESGSVIYNDNAATCVGRTYVENGSLNAYRLAMSGAGEFESLNPSLKSQIKTRSIQIEGTVYAAPVNYFGTKLTMFKLTGEGDFDVYDPNEDDSYTYAYVSDNKGNSYVWAPVAVVHYDATEGAMAVNEGDTVQAGDSFVNRDDGTQIGCAATSTEKGYEASDYTISGQSLSMLGGQLPTAERENYTFAGWYTTASENVEAAERFAENGNYEELYKLLTVKFDENTVIEEADSEITVYAKWSKHYGPDENPDGFDVNITKTAEELNANDETTVQLGIGSTENRNKVAVLFVLDYSTSVNVRNAAAAMLEELASKDKTDVKVGVVNYWAEADEGSWTSITENTDVEELLTATQTGGTNYHAGLLSAKSLLESDEINGYTTYLITISDGITYLWTDETTGDTMSVWFQNIGNGAADIQNANDVYSMKYHNGAIDDDTFYALINGSSDIMEKYEYTIQKAEVYGAGKPTPDETGRYWALVDDDVKESTLVGNEIAILKTASVYKELAQSVDYAFAFKMDENHWGDYPYGEQLMDYLISQADGGSISNTTAESTFNTIKNQILYAIEKGSVTDVIGNDFDLKGVDTFKLTAGGTEIQGAVDAANENLVNFGTADENGVYPYTVEYVPGAAGEEHFVWTINVPVENANGLALSYVLKLVNKNTEAGTYGQYDRDGSKGYADIQTNESAVLEYETTEGDTGSKNFPKPTVSYTVTAQPTPEEPTPEEPTVGTAELTITKKVQNTKGNEKKVTATFYASVFTDAAYQNRYGKVIELKLADASETSVTVELETPADGSERTYYVMETDQNGNVVNSGKEFGYQINVKGGQVTVSKSDSTAQTVITNQQVKKGSGSHSSGSDDESTGTSAVSNTQQVGSAKTGDNANIMLYVVLAVIAAAALAACGTIAYKKRKMTK